MSTQNLCFGAKMRKICIPMHTPVCLYKSGVQGGILFMDMFSWWNFSARRSLLLPPVWNKCPNGTVQHDDSCYMVSHEVVNWPIALVGISNTQNHQVIFSA